MAAAARPPACPCLQAFQIAYFVFHLCIGSLYSGLGNKGKENMMHILFKFNYKPKHSASQGLFGEIVDNHRNAGYGLLVCPKVCLQIFPEIEIVTLTGTKMSPNHTFQYQFSQFPLYLVMAYTYTG